MLFSSETFKKIGYEETFGADKQSELDKMIDNNAFSNDSETDSKGMGRNGR